MAEIPRVDSLSQAIAVSGFTNGLHASGHIDLTDELPHGAMVLGWKGEITTRFTGSTGGRVELDVGSPGDPDAFSAAGPKRVEGVGNWISDIPRADSAFDNAGNARKVRVTLTDTFDFDNITGGALTIEVFYLQTEAR